MQRFRSSNFSNIQTMFHEKSGVDTKPHTKRHKAQKTLALLLVVLLSGFPFPPSDMPSFPRWQGTNYPCIPCIGVKAWWKFMWKIVPPQI